MPWSDLAWATVVTMFFAIPIAITVWCLLDAARRPSWAWALAERNQALWIGGILLGLCSVVGGLVVCVWYLVKVRPSVAAAEEGRIDHRSRTSS
jgi:uncharacterized membrane protein YeiB